jgi:subtilase family serine protease
MRYATAAGLGLLIAASGAKADPAGQQTVALSGNTRPEAIFRNDRGRVADDFPLEHLEMLLNRPPAKEVALKQYIDRLSDPASPDYHRWLSAEQIGAGYGPSAEDIGMVTHWLQAQGFVVNAVHTNGMVVDFSGDAGKVREAFGTEMHRLEVNGVTHIANMSEPRVPAALAGIVNGIVSLNDFRPHPDYRPRPAYSFNSFGTSYQVVVPGDLATIYNLKPLFASGVSGQGQTIVLIEDTNVYKTSDWTTFRSKFGLSTYTGGSLTQVHPSASGNACSNPGVVPGNEGEATLDVEWASAAAPSAAIELASCADTATNFGGLIALQNLVNGSSPPAIVSISYGECEAENGASQNAAFYTTYQQAAAEGVSVFVSAGDEGAASCDADLANATHGIGVSGFASTPYNVAVGGTDFGDTYAGTTGTYWSSKNSSTYESAKSYIPEIPWNDSCASVLLAAYNGYTTAYGSGGFCNSLTGEEAYLTTAGGSGGPSGCATGAPSRTGVVGGSCKGYAKPSWQVLVGNPADGVRDIPDVSLFAANGIWGHYYVYCDSDARDEESCSGAPKNWSAAGGTSFASPILAAMQALVNQKQGARQGNPNPVYYQLAATEYGTSGSSICNSSKGSAVSASCIFYDTTQGDIDVNCTGANNCYKPSGHYGVLSTSDSAYKKAYGTTTGWDFATGIGSVNAANLVNGWPAPAAAAPVP